MTEEEAKTKWCPMVRIGDMNAPTGLNRGNNSNNNCIASDCAMWVWDPKYNAMKEQLVPTSGHCGLIK